MAALLAGQGLAAREITVRGTVRDEQRQPLPAVSITVKHTTHGTLTDAQGRYAIAAEKGDTLQFSFIGYKTEEKVVTDSVMDVTLRAEENAMEEVVVTGYHTVKRVSHTGAVATMAASPLARSRMARPPFIPANQEEYRHFTPNTFLLAMEEPLSTFSIDVDAASYANARRYLNNGQLPPKDAIRTEEFVNYFRYDYPTPRGDAPVSVTTETATAPWNSAHRLVRIGIKAKEVETKRLPASNLVFLIDVSGSMYAPNKLPLLKSSLKLLVEQLRPQDRVAIVTYANGTKEALARKKAEGVRLGRPKGPGKRALDGREGQIAAMLAAGLTKVRIAKAYGVHVSTVHEFLTVKRLR